MIGQEIVVHEKEELPLLRLDLLYHFAYVAAILGAVKERAHRAKGAGKTATAAELQQRDRQGGFALEQGAPRQRAGLRSANGRLVHGLKLAAPPVLDHFCPVKLCITDVDRVPI